MIINKTEHIMKRGIGSSKNHNETKHTRKDGKKSKKEVGRYNSE